MNAATTNLLTIFFDNRPCCGGSCSLCYNSCFGFDTLYKDDLLEMLEDMTGDTTTIVDMQIIDWDLLLNEINQRMTNDAADTNPSLNEVVDADCCGDPV